MDSWTVAQAKARLSEVIASAQSRGPQAITRNGRQAVVVVAADQSERKPKRSGSLAAFFANSPLRDSGLQVDRKEGGLRKLSETQKPCCRDGPSEPASDLIRGAGPESMDTVR